MYECNAFLIDRKIKKKLIDYWTVNKIVTWNENKKNKMFKNKGQVYSIDTDQLYPFKPPRYGQYGEGKKMIF